MTNSELHLDPPGAGIPFYERLIAKYILLPRAFRKMTWGDAQSFFDHQADEILKITCSLTKEDLVRKVLVERLPGLEDSSRFWSVAMTIEHSIIAGAQMAFAIGELTQGRVPETVADTAKVKPHDETDPGQIRGEFEKFSKNFKTQMEKIETRDSTLKYKHPWFGGLTAHQWHCMAGIHLRLHRQQIQMILLGMPEVT